MKLQPNEYVSDKILPAEYIRWSSGQRILITGSPNTGKTDFAVKYLEACVKSSYKGLYITNRRTAKDYLEAQHYPKSFDTITYFELIRDAYFGHSGLASYKYIVFDESHAIFTDSYFQSHTDILLNHLFCGCRNSIVIFITINAKLLNTYISNYNKPGFSRTYDFYKPLLFNNCYAFFHLSQVIKVLRNLPPNEKAIFFGSKEAGRTVYNELKKSSVWIFEDSRRTLASKGRKSQLDVERIDTLNAIVANQPFNNQILIATNMLTYGIKYPDANIKHLICDFFDLDILSSAIGRLSPLPGRPLPSLYIHQRQDMSFQQKNANEHLEIINDLHNDFNAFCLKHASHDVKCMVYPLPAQSQPFLPAPNKSSNYVVNTVAEHKTKDNLALANAITPRGDFAKNAKPYIGLSHVQIIYMVLPKKAKPSADASLLPSLVQMLEGYHLSQIQLYNNSDANQKRCAGDHDKLIRDDLLALLEKATGKSHGNKLQQWNKTLDAAGLPYTLNSHGKNTERYWTVSKNISVQQADGQDNDSFDHDDASAVLITQ